MSGKNDRHGGRKAKHIRVIDNCLLSDSMNHIR